MARSDEKAMEAALSFQRGEEKGFNYFFKELYSALFGYSFLILNDRLVVEDIVEESFIKIWKIHSTFDHPKVVSAWLYTTVKHACWNYLKENALRKKREALVGAYLEDHEESVEHKIIRAEITHMRIAEANRYIESLPRECRKIFELLFKKGMSAREASIYLNVSISTIKNQKARGLGLIQELILNGKKEKRHRTGTIRLLRENDSTAWLSIYEENKESFKYLININISDSEKKDIILNAIDDVRAKKYSYENIPSYITEVNKTIRGKKQEIAASIKKARKNARSYKRKKKPVSIDVSGIYGIWLMGLSLKTISNLLDLNLKVVSNSYNSYKRYLNKKLC